MFFFFISSLSAGYLFAKKRSKLNPDICALCLIKHQISPAVIGPRSDQIRYLSYLDFERTPCRSLGDSPETAIDRSPSRGALRGCHCREHVLELVHLNSRSAQNLKNEQRRRVFRCCHRWVSLNLDQSNGFVFLCMWLEVFRRCDAACAPVMSIQPWAG